MFKKLTLFLTLIMCLCSFSPMNAENEGNKVFDNLYLGGSVGLVDPLYGNGLKPSRWNFGLEFGKDFSHIVGLSVEGLANVNTTPSHTAFDQTLLMGNVKFNLTNALLGYNGKPRVFEFIAYPSAGWRYSYGVNRDKNEACFRLGADWNFNLGKERAWTLAAKTGLIYPHNAHIHGAAFDARLSLVYHFKNSVGKHYITSSRSHFTDDDYYRVIAEKDAAMKKYRTAQAALENVRTKTDTIIVVRHDVTKELAEVVIPFSKGSNSLSVFNPMLEKIADDVIDTKKNLVVTGYASVEGSETTNYQLSLDRANAVKNALVNLGVDARRISVVAGGSTDKFGDDYTRNRVVVIEKK